LNQYIPSLTASKPRTIKRSNQRAVLELFRYNESLSIGEISGLISLSKTSVTKIIGAFLESGVIKSLGKGPSTDEGGKRPELFGLEASRLCTVAISLYHNAFDVALLNVHAEAFYYENVQFSPTLDYEDVVKALTDGTVRILDERGLKPDQIMGIVVGCAGVVDSHQRMIRTSIRTNWNLNLPIGDDLEAALPFSVPIFVDNFVRFQGYASFMREDSNIDNLVFIFSSAHTGGCVIIDREIVSGTNSFVGEIGHMIIDPKSNIRCNCGNYGCFEETVNIDRIAAETISAKDGHRDSSLYLAADARTLNINDIFAAADGGDAWAQEILDGIVQNFTVLIQNLTVTCDPQKVIISGAYGRSGRYFPEKLSESVAKLSFYKTQCEIIVECSETDTSQNFFSGAGGYTFQHFLSRAEF